jgi:hypothetical protein
MRLLWMWPLLGSTLVAPPAAAQGAVAVPAAAAIERMCSTTGAYQYAFGETGVPGGSKLERSFSRGFALPASAAPFERAKPWSTEWSDRLLAIEYIAPPLDEVALERFAGDLGAVLAGAGWRPKPDDYDPPLYMMIAAGEWTWTRPGPASPEATELVLGLSQGLGELTLTCGRSDLMLTQAREAFGELPPGTPRPAVPEIPVPPIRAEDDCAKPDVAARVGELMTARGTGSFMVKMVARTTYRDRLTSWMVWKLEQSGKITPERLLDLGFSAIGSVSPDGNALAQFEMLGEMFDLLEPLARAEEAQDTEALCRSIVPLQGWFARVDALTSKQTEAMHAVLTAEASRLGVSLD